MKERVCDDLQAAHKEAEPMQDMSNIDLPRPLKAAKHRKIAA